MAANPLFITFRGSCVCVCFTFETSWLGSKKHFKSRFQIGSYMYMGTKYAKKKNYRGCAYPAPCTNLPLPNLHTAPLHRPHHSPTLSPILVYARPRALRNFPQCSKSPSYMLFLIVTIWTEPKGIATGMINHAPSWYVTKNFHEQMTSFFIFSFSNFSQID